LQEDEKKLDAGLSVLNEPPSSLGILLYKLNIRCGGGFREAVEKRGYRDRERAHAQINSRKHEALPCRFACLLGGKSLSLSLTWRSDFFLLLSRNESCFTFLHPRLPLSSFSKQKSPLWWSQPGEENSILSRKS
jgi:hypothetical protein